MAHAGRAIGALPAGKPAGTRRAVIGDCANMGRGDRGFTGGQARRHTPGGDRGMRGYGAGEIGALPAEPAGTEQAALGALGSLRRREGRAPARPANSPEARRAIFARIWAGRSGIGAAHFPRRCGIPAVFAPPAPYTIPRGAVPPHFCGGIGTRRARIGACACPRLAPSAIPRRGAVGCRRGWVPCGRRYSRNRR